MSGQTEDQDFQLDLTSQQIFWKFYKNLPEKTVNTIRFFNRGEYYTLHEQDALTAAKDVFKTTSVCKKFGKGSNASDYMCMKRSIFENYVKELLTVKMYRIEVYCNQGTDKSPSWTIEYQGSPGNFTQVEDLVLGDQYVSTTLIVMAIKISLEGMSKTVGVSCIDSLSFSILVCEFKDDESFSQLESLMVAVQPKECLVPHSENDEYLEKLRALCERNNVLLSPRSKTEFNSQSTEQDLNQLVKFNKGQMQNVSCFPEMSLKLAACSTTALIKYLDLLSNEDNFHQYSFKELKHTSFVKLDSAVLSALNVDSKKEGAFVSSQNSSITSVLDKCKTSQGKRLLAQWIRQPLKDLKALNDRHDIVDTLQKETTLRFTLTQDILRRIPDLQQLGRKISRKKATLQDCYKVSQSLNHITTLLDKLSDLSEVSAVKNLILDPLEKLLEESSGFQDMINQTIDLEAAQNGEFFVTADFDGDLKEVKEVMDEREKRMLKHLNKVASDLDLEAGKTIKLEVNSQHGYHFRVTLQNEKIIRNNKHYTILDSLKAGVRFNDSKLDDLNQDYMQAKAKYTTLQKSIVDEIVKTAGTYNSAIRSIGEVVAILDVLNSFAQAAAVAPKEYVRPKMLPKSANRLKLKQVRHPCLELQEDVHFIPNDVEFDENSKFFIVTGPNMGGKSIYIRSVGVAALMAHIGSFVPCEEAEISLLDCITARVGAEDSQLKGLSTFMVEMLETASIIKMATESSLVIIDELGRGTSTYEGCGLAWSIAEYLAKEVKPFCLFATHFHEITKLEEEVPTVKNLHITAQVYEELTFLYKVVPGICDQSFGIHVARKAQLPEDVIQSAEKKQLDLENLQGLAFTSSNNAQNNNEIMSEGQKRIDEFIEKIKDLKNETKPDLFNEKVNSLKSEILSTNNSFVNSLLA